MALFDKKPTNLRLTIPPLQSQSFPPPLHPENQSINSQNFPNCNTIPILSAKGVPIPFAIYDDEAKLTEPWSPPQMRPVPILQPFTDARTGLDNALAKIYATMNRLSPNPEISSRRLSLPAIDNAVKKIHRNDPSSLIINDYFHNGESLASSGYLYGSGPNTVIIPPISADFAIPTEIYAYYDLTEKPRPPPSRILRGPANLASIYASAAIGRAKRKDAKRPRTVQSPIGGERSNTAGTPNSEEMEFGDGANDMQEGPSPKNPATGKERAAMRQFTGVWGQLPEVLRRRNRTSGRKNFARRTGQRAIERGDVVVSDE